MFRSTYKFALYARLANNKNCHTAYLHIMNCTTRNNYASWINQSNNIMDLSEDSK